MSTELMLPLHLMLQQLLLLLLLLWLSPVPHAWAAVQPDEHRLADLQRQVAQEMHHKLQQQQQQ
jgi:hypothetical protein